MGRIISLGGRPVEKLTDKYFIVGRITGKDALKMFGSRIAGADEVNRLFFSHPKEAAKVMSRLNESRREGFIIMGFGVYVEESLIKYKHAGCFLISAGQDAVVSASLPYGQTTDAIGADRLNEGNMFIALKLFDLEDRHKISVSVKPEYLATHGDCLQVFQPATANSWNLQARGYPFGEASIIENPEALYFKTFRLGVAANGIALGRVGVIARGSILGPDRARTISLEGPKATGMVLVTEDALETFAEANSKLKGLKNKTSIIIEREGLG